MWDDVIFSLIIQFGGGIRFGYGIVLLCVLLLRSFDFHMVWPLTQKGDGFLGARPTVAAWTIASFPSKSHSSLAAIPRSAWATEAMRCRLGRGRAGPQCRSHAMPPFSATPHATKGATQNFSRATEISNWATVCIALLDVEKERWIIIMVATYTKINWSNHVSVLGAVQSYACSDDWLAECSQKFRGGAHRSPGRQAGPQRSDRSSPLVAACHAHCPLPGKGDPWHAQLQNQEPR